MFKKDYLTLDFKTPIWHIQGKPGGPKLLIYSGVHGYEDASFQVAYEMVEEFRTQSDLQGEVTILPAVNLLGVLLGTRTNPIDNENINSVSEPPEREGKTVSQELADDLLKIAQKHNFVLSLHSGSVGNYFNHVMLFNAKDAELARSFGFEYLLLCQKNKLSKGAKPGARPPVIEARVRSKEIPTLVLEVGSGHFIYSKMVVWAKKGILNFASKIGMLPPKDYGVVPTPKEKIFKEKDQVIVKLPETGMIFFTKGIGKIYKKGERVAYIVDFGRHQRVDLESPIDGQLVWKRVKTKIEPGEVGKETAFRMIPSTKIHNKHFFEFPES